MSEPLGLRATLESAGGSMKSLTVLAPQNDPFRVDTPSGHRDGAWLRDQMTELGVSGERHLRGLHYIMLGREKPNCLPYTNTDVDWLWLSASAAKAARWLGYIDFDQIVDQRNATPEIVAFTPADPEPFISVDFEVFVPDYEDLRPRVGVDGFTEAQPYHIALVGEKHSLKPVLSSVARRYQASLYLPTGEMSDTMCHTMARSAVRDGRPLVVFYFADCDPSGWQMSISLARKLQALKALKFHDLQFEVHRVGLTPNQVRLHGLPSTPLKASEKRASQWQSAMGVEQTEIDSLAALQPDLLGSIADAAIAPFFDELLSLRVQQAQWDWEARAQLVVDEHDGDQLRQVRIDAATRLDEKRAEIRDILNTVRVDAHQFLLPPIPDVPSARVDVGGQAEPLCDSTWDFTKQCRRLIESKSYDDTDGRVS